MRTQLKLKTGYDLRLKALIDERATRQGLLSQEARHWPGEVLEFAYAVACLEIVLLHSDKANSIYNEIVRAWNLPGCQTVMDGFESCLPVTNDWKTKALKAREKGELFPDWPSEWLATYFQHAPVYFEDEAHNTDWEYLLNKLNEFILVGFNRQADQDNEAWKVIPDTSPLLKGVIIMRSQAEYAGVKLEDLSKYQPVKIDNKVYDLNTVMADKPTVGPERKVYRALTDAYQALNFRLKHSKKLLKDADQWYKCRVNPGTIEAYLDELAKANDTADLDRGNAENAIAPCDQATGYPRRWRK
jgi:hypothetical protein